MKKTLEQYYIVDVAHKYMPAGESIPPFDELPEDLQGKIKAAYEWDKLMFDLDKSLQELKAHLLANQQAG